MRPKLQYLCSAWDSHYQKDKAALERLQWKAPRFVTGNYDQTASVFNFFNFLFIYLFIHFSVLELAWYPLDVADRTIFGLTFSCGFSRSRRFQAPTSSPGLFPWKWVGRAHPFFKGKALGTRLSKLFHIAGMSRKWEVHENMSAWHVLFSCSQFPGRVSRRLEQATPAGRYVRPGETIVCYTAFLCVVTQCSSPQRRSREERCVTTEETVLKETSSLRAFLRASSPGVLRGTGVGEGRGEGVRS